MPANGGLLQFCRPSLDSRFRDFGPGFEESLRPHAEIFPFSGDWRRRPGSTASVPAGAVQIDQRHCRDNADQDTESFDALVGAASNRSFLSSLAFIGPSSRGEADSHYIAF